MDDFKIKFRGVRGSFPVANKNFMHFGGNTSCVEVNVGGHKIILDAGTGIVGAGDDYFEQYISSGLTPDERTPIDVTILISHIHQDHLLGLTFFKPLHLKSSNIKIYGKGDPDLSKNLSELVFGRTFPLDLGDIACNLDINNLTNEGKIVLKKGKSPIVVPVDYLAKKNEVVISYYNAYVHPQLGVMVYKISYNGKSLVYATDKESFLGGDKKFIKFAKDCDILIHDSQYTTEDYLNVQSPKQGYGHSTYDMAVEAMRLANAKKLVFFHYDPNYDDNKLSHLKAYYDANYKNTQLSYEGLELKL